MSTPLGGGVYATSAANVWLNTPDAFVDSTLCFENVNTPEEFAAAELLA